MIKNYYYLIAGVLALIGTIGHVYVGHKSILTEIDKLDVRHAVFLFLHQTTLFMIVSCIVLFCGALGIIKWNINVGAWMIFAVFGGNFLVHVIYSSVMNKNALDQIIPQLIFTLLYLGTIYMGIHKSAN